MVTRKVSGVFKFYNDNEYYSLEVGKEGVKDMQYNVEDNYVDVYFEDKDTIRVFRPDEITYEGVL